MSVNKILGAPSPSSYRGVGGRWSCLHGNRDDTVRIYDGYRAAGICFLPARRATRTCFIPTQHLVRTSSSAYHIRKICGIFSRICTGFHTMCSSNARIECCGTIGWWVNRFECYLRFSKFHFCIVLTVVMFCVDFILKQSVNILKQNVNEYSKCKVHQLALNPKCLGLGPVNVLLISIRSYVPGIYDTTIVVDTWQYYYIVAYK